MKKNKNPATKSITVPLKSGHVMPSDWEGVSSFSLPAGTKYTPEKIQPGMLLNVVIGKVPEPLYEIIGFRISHWPGVDIPGYEKTFPKKQDQAAAVFTLKLIA